MVEKRVSTQRTPSVETIHSKTTDRSRRSGDMEEITTSICLGTREAPQPAGRVMTITVNPPHPEEITLTEGSWVGDGWFTVITKNESHGWFFVARKVGRGPVPYL